MPDSRRPSKLFHSTIVGGGSVEASNDASLVVHRVRRSVGTSTENTSLGTRADAKVKPSSRLLLQATELMIPGGSAAAGRRLIDRKSRISSALLAWRSNTIAASEPPGRT